MNRLFVAAVAALSIAALPALTHEAKKGDLRIGHPWSRATAPSAPNGGAYLTVENKGTTADRLLAVRGDVAGKIELHTHTMKDGVMQMRPVEAIDVPAGGKVELKPGGLHVMLLGLKAPLVKGEHFPLTLVFERAGEVPVEVVVDTAGVAAPSTQHGH
ncbi:MAG: copper chaperone PCu(A)C [Alphaproteobacteria bacterium]|nr:copper chaperone PCu(A)C [Alphaproteobacteria bacterium]